MSKSLSPAIGFTIVELLIVIVVIGVLAALVVVAYSGIQARAQVAAVSSGLTQAYDKLALYYIDNNAYPLDLATVEITSAGATAYQYSVDNLATPRFFCVSATNGSTNYSVSSTITNPIVGGCAGHGLSGVPDVTNLMINPRAQAVGVGWSANNGAIHTVTRGVAINGHPNAIVTAARSQLKAGQSSSEVLSIYNIDGLGVSATQRSISVWVYASGPGYLARIYGDGNPSSVAIVPAPAGSWVLLKTSGPLTGNATVVVYKSSGSNADSSDYALATGSVVVTGSKTYNFADGASPNWAWNGAVNASTSTGPLLP